MKFTTDSSNVNFGGTNGIIAKIQAALDAQYYLASSAIFEERVIVGIINGDLRFTSGQRLSTSAILIAAPSAGETTPFGVGRFPAIGSIDGPVAARLPDDVVYDNISNIASPNANVFGYDDGMGRIKGMCAGTINYDTGAIDLIACPVNAEFVYSASHTSVFAGALNDATAARFNCLIEVLANNPSQKWDGRVQVRQYK